LKASARAGGLVIALALAGAAVAPPACAQIAGSNLLLLQLGNWPPSLPDRGTPDRESFYDRLDVQYVSQNVLAGARFETDRNSDLENEYAGFTQRFVDWRDGDAGLHLRVGNCTTILGRGLVHRSFELPGVVLEETGFRTRFTPVRDVDGALAEFERGPLALRAIGGAPSEGDVSLAQEEILGVPRHHGHIAGGQAVVALPWQAHTGAIVLRSPGGIDPATGLPLQHTVGSGFVDLDPLRSLGVKGPALPTYVEYAQEDRTFGQWWQFDVSDPTPHALYAGTNLLWGAFALSLEWKDYSQFRLGTNDPPSLVPEHTEVLLNRTTHVLVADDETGYQAEASWSPVPWGSLVLNRTRADGARGDRYEEWYTALRALPRGGARVDGGAFYDRGADSTTGITRRDTYGLDVTGRWRARWSAKLDVERQTSERKGFIPATSSVGLTHFEDVHVALVATLADFGSAGFTWDRTTDELDPSWEAGHTGPLHLFSWNASAHISDGNEAVLFLGKRRGGLACTAGTCYVVQPFEGFEMRLVSRF
jgi:hypothetical protein